MRRFPMMIALLGWTALVAPIEATATPVRFDVTLTVLSVECFTSPPVVCFPPTIINPLPQPGDTWGVGFFVVDDALLSQTGVNLPGVLTAFHIQTGNLTWDAFQPFDEMNNRFAGFRGPIPGNPDCPGGGGDFPSPGRIVCLGAPSPGFDVANGTVTQIYGGFFDPADFANAFFEVFYGPNRFALGDQLHLVHGSVTITRSPEPTSFFLLGCGILVLAGIAWRRHRRQVNSSHSERLTDWLPTDRQAQDWLPF